MHPVVHATRLLPAAGYPLTNPTTVGQALGANAAGATMSYYDGYGEWIGSYTLTGDMIQSIPVVLSPYTPTQTPSATASLTVGATPSTTATASWTPTSTQTPSITPSAPLLPYAYKVTLTSSSVLNFIEVRGWGGNTRARARVSVCVCVCVCGVGGGGGCNV